MSYDWGFDEPPAPQSDPPEPLPPRLAWLAGLTGPEIVEDLTEMQPRADELPEVLSLMANGWRPVPRARFDEEWPALWPRKHRCWVPDRLPRYGSSSFDDILRVEPPGYRPLPARMVSRTKIPGEPEILEVPEAVQDRIWLLRSPWPWLGVSVVISAAIQRLEEVDPDFTAKPEVVRNFLSWSEARMRGWWTGKEASLALDWEAAGRTGEEVAGPILKDLGPAEMALLPGLSGPDAAIWCERVGLAGPAAAERIRLWRDLGVDDPPEYLYRFHDWTPEKIRDWLASGLYLPTMLVLMELPLEQARLWVGSGYSARQIMLLTNADNAITPPEVARFSELGFGDRDRLGWIGCGFTADEAKGYVAVDIRPQEARVWRAKGLGPGDIQPGERTPPGYQMGGWASFAGTDPRDISHSIEDPPGTRGSVAGRARERGRRPLRHRRDRRSGDQETPGPDSTAPES